MVFAGEVDAVFALIMAVLVEIDPSLLTEVEVELEIYLNLDSPCGLAVLACYELGVKRSEELASGQQQQRWNCWCH